MAKRRYKRKDLGRPAAGPVTITKADGTVEVRSALPASAGAGPNSQRVFGTHSKEYRRKTNKGIRAKSVK